MANRTRPEQIPAWQQQAWLTEYQVCQQHNDSVGSEVWVSTTIFLTINVTLLGGLFYSFMTRIVLENPDLESISLALRIITLVGFTALSLGILWILKKWVNWLKRMRFRVAMNFERMREIEQSLGMRKQTMSRELDLVYDRLNTYDYTARKALRKAFKERNKRLPFFRAGAYSGLIYIAKIVMVLWCVFILAFWSVVAILAQG
jgi:hypothetical protein